MKDIYQGPVYEFLINESLNNRMGWGGNAGSIDGISEYDLNNSRRGTTFMREFLTAEKPFTILETGTNYGSFSYVLYETLEDFKLFTCDAHSDNQSMRCVNFINEYYDDNKIFYQNINSIQLLTQLHNTGIKVDLAWLDSTHTYDMLLEELLLTKSLQAKFIMIDDFWTQKELQNAVLDFVRKNGEYRIHSFSNIRENVGSIIILQRVEADNLNLI
jgi:cephalosporin hydroxylase